MTDFMLDFHQNPNPSYSSYIMDNSGLPDFELSDYLMLGDGTEEDSISSFIGFSSQTNPEKINDDEAVGNNSGDTSRSTSNIKCKSGVKKPKVDLTIRVAFRTKSELEIMDDGFKWRKYGRKTVKNSPNPRNYFRCSNAGCNVKKRVERDREDSNYVITTYEGVHNHASPCVVYYNQRPLMVPNGWSLQASLSSSS